MGTSVTFSDYITRLYDKFAMRYAIQQNLLLSESSNYVLEQATTI